MGVWIMVLAKTYTYTFSEFRNKDLIKEMNRVENLLNHIKKHRRLYSKLWNIFTEN